MLSRPIRYYQRYMGDFYVNNKPIRRGLYPSIVTYIIPINNNYIIYNIFYIYPVQFIIQRSPLTNIDDATPRPAFHFSLPQYIIYIIYELKKSFITYGSVCSIISSCGSLLSTLPPVILNNHGFSNSKSIKSIPFFLEPKDPYTLISIPQCDLVLERCETDLTEKTAIWMTTDN